MSGPTKTTSEISWLRIGAEGAAIVISILLAFSIDAWWDTHRDRNEEQEILLSLEAEFSAYVEYFESRVLFSDLRLRRLRYLLDGSIDNGAPIPPDTLDLAFLSIMLAETFDPGRSARDALISSGRLELVSDRELRERLAAWEHEVDELRDNQLAVRTYVLEILVPFLAGRGLPLSRPLSMTTFWDVHPDAPLEVRTAPRRPEMTPELIALYRRTVADSVFQGLLAYRYFWDAGSSKDYRALLQSASAIVDLIRQPEKL